MKKNAIKRLTKVKNMLLPFVYKYPYNHHKPMPPELITAIQSLNKWGITN